MSQSQSQRRKKSERLPYDVVYDILSRLAVKSLMRFRCVSKSCNSIITNPIFIKTHLDRANGYLLYINDASEYPPYRRELSMVVYNTVTEIYRFQIPFSHLCIAGFCNGMFYLHNYDKNELYLWNPSIRKFKMLSAPHLTDTSAPHLTDTSAPHLTVTSARFTVAMGLAYHSQNNDFKILRIYPRMIGEGWMLPAKADVYTLSTDSWRVVVTEVESQTIYIGNIPEKYCLFHNGALHTIVNSAAERDYILSFDVNDEIFRKIKLPQSYFDEPFYSNIKRSDITSLAGSLAFIVFCDDICHIWVMREYGVVESWTKKSVPMDLVDNFYLCTPNGELLIGKDTGLVLFDPETLNENKLAIKDAQWMDYIPNSMESLVLLDGRNV